MKIIKLLFTLTILSMSFSLWAAFTLNCPPYDQVKEWKSGYRYTWDSKEWSVSAREDTLKKHSQWAAILPQMRSQPEHAITLYCLTDSLGKGKNTFIFTTINDMPAERCYIKDLKQEIKYNSKPHVIQGLHEIYCGD